MVQGVGGGGAAYLGVGMYSGIWRVGAWVCTGALMALAVLTVGRAAFGGGAAGGDGGAGATRLWIAAGIVAGFAGVSAALLLAGRKHRGRKGAVAAGAGGGAEHAPPLFVFLFALVGLLDGAGYAWELYTRPGPFDELSHLFTSFVISLTLAYATYRSVRGHFRSHPVLFALVVSSFGISVGVAWEWLEALIGIINSLGDTLMDLVMDVAGSALAGALGAWALRHEPDDRAPSPG